MTGRQMLSAAGVALLATTSALGAVTFRWSEVPVKDHQRVNPLAGNPKALDGGRLLYNEKCAQCHQAEGRGDGQKRPSLHSEQVRSATDGDLEWFLRRGDLRHGMPSWSSLPQSQRWQLVTYLRSLQ